jgi:deoxyribodipyrimidine photolyase
VGKNFVALTRFLRELDDALRKRGGGLIVLHGDSPEIIAGLAAALDADAVHANRDYEPTAVEAMGDLQNAHVR